MKHFREGKNLVTEFGFQQRVGDPSCVTVYGSHRQGCCPAGRLQAIPAPEMESFPGTCLPFPVDSALCSFAPPFGQVSVVFGSVLNLVFSWTWERKSTLHFFYTEMPKTVQSSVFLLGQYFSV